MNTENTQKISFEPDGSLTIQTNKGIIRGDNVEVPLEGNFTINAHDVKILKDILSNNKSFRLEYSYFTTCAYVSMIGSRKEINEVKDFLNEIHEIRNKYYEIRNKYNNLEDKINKFNQSRRWFEREINITE
jgi:hypothetical protein